MTILRGAVVLAFFVAGCASPIQPAAITPPAGASAVRQSTVPSSSALLARRTSTVAHIVIIEMENRSFDNLFGTFPGANGIPSHPNCNPDPRTGQCVMPYHDTSLVNYGGPHSTSDMWTDIDGGKLDGFIISAEKSYIDPQADEVMGYHTCAEVPVYCAYAQKYTLADNNFAASSSWSSSAHLYLVSAWSAICTIKGDPMSCKSANDINPVGADFAWTDITWLLHSHGISWGYYVYGHGLLGPYLKQNDGEDPEPFTFNQPTMWNPLPGFDDVRLDGQQQDIQQGNNFLAQAAAGTLPAVSWVVPPFESSDHPPAPINYSQSWVRKQVDAVMDGPDGPSTLILLTWDEWGGFYDHVVPQVIDSGGYGFRTPLILIGPMVRRAYIDHQLLTSDAYLKLIEDTFLGSARIDANDGRPDSRPDVRENVQGLGDLRSDLTGGP